MDGGFRGGSLSLFSPLLSRLCLPPLLPSLPSLPFLKGRCPSFLFSSSFKRSAFSSRCRIENPEGKRQRRESVWVERQYLGLTSWLLRLGRGGGGGSPRLGLCSCQFLFDRPVLLAELFLCNEHCVWRRWDSRLKQVRRSLSRTLLEMSFRSWASLIPRSLSDLPS